MSRLIQMEGENFAGFRSFNMKLSNQGLTFIAGQNNDTEAANSNGACKTGLFKAIGWCLYGRSIDEVVGDEVIHLGQKYARVSIEIEDGEDSYLVIRERRKQQPKLFLKRNDEEVKGSKNDLQGTIDRLVGTDWEGFRNTVLYGQRDRDRFVYPTTSDSDRKKILHRIIRTGVFEFAYEEAKRRRRGIDKELTAAKSDVDRQTLRIEDFDLDKIQDRVDNFDSERKSKLKSLVDQAKSLSRKAKSAIPNIDESSLRVELLSNDKRSVQLSSEIEAAKKKRQVARDEYRSATRDVARLEAEFKSGASTLELLAGDQCPTCTGSLEKGRAAAHKRSLESSQVRVKDDLARARESRQEAARAETEAESAIERAEDEISALVELSRVVRNELDSVETGKRRAKELAEEAKRVTREARVLKESENPYLPELEAATEKVRKLKRERRKAKERVKELTDDLAHLEFWVRGFSPNGVPSFALDSVMPFITERANHHLKTLSDGDITINFSTQRELKSAAGELRDKIGITWFIEGIENYPPSGGQWKKMEIATNFALMDLVATREGSHVNILCLDECLDGLDREGKQRVVDLLHKLRAEKESVFMISHDAELAEIFERTLIVIKEDGVSRLEKAA